MVKKFAKKGQSVRQKAAEGEKVTKRRKLRTVASTPIKSAQRGLFKAAKPFNFLLRPLRTRPVRFIGRILSKVLFVGYFVNSWRELRKVTWPNRKQTIQLTFAVFVFAIIFAVFVSVVDFGLDKLFRKVFLS